MPRDCGSVQHQASLGWGRCIETFDAFSRLFMSTVWDAHTYDSERRRLVPCFDDFYGTVAEMVARFCPLPPRILDLGAGTGILSSVIVERVAVAELSLLDASADMLQRAATRLAQRRLEVLVQPLTEELPRGPFDAVVSALAIHHLKIGRAHV